MQKLTAQELRTILSGTALLDYFRDTFFAKYPEGVPSLDSFANISEEVFPDDEELQKLSMELIDEVIASLTEIGEKYAKKHD